MIGWLVTGAWVLGYTLHTMKHRKRSTMSEEFWWWRDNDPIGMWLIWAVITWHFMFREKPKS